MQVILFIFVILNYIKLIKCDMEGFMIDGEKADILKFPHSAVLKVVCKTNPPKKKGIRTCGASIVSEKLLLTSATCLYTCNRKSNINVSVGHSDRSKGDVFTVKRFFLHQRYNQIQRRHDIALVTLTTSFKFGPNVKRVALMRDPPPDTTAQIASWSLAKEEPKNRHGKYLMYMDQYVNNRRCRELGLNRGAFCAETKSGNDFSSGGETGSALVVRGYIQIGIFSFEVLDVYNGMSVYTNISYYYDWIEKNSRGMCCG